MYLFDVTILFSIFDQFIYPNLDDSIVYNSNTELKQLVFKQWLTWTLHEVLLIPINTTLNKLLLIDLNAVPLENLALWETHVFTYFRCLNQPPKYAILKDIGYYNERELYLSFH